MNNNEGGQLQSCKLHLKRTLKTAKVENSLSNHLKNLEKKTRKIRFNKEESEWWNRKQITQFEY